MQLNATRYTNPELTSSAHQGHHTYHKHCASAYHRDTTEARSTQLSQRPLVHQPLARMRIHSRAVLSPSPPPHNQAAKEPIRKPTMRAQRAFRVVRSHCQRPLAPLALAP